MEHKERITSEDTHMAYGPGSDWQREMAQNLKNIQREPVNCDEESQACLMNVFWRRL